MTRRKRGCLIALLIVAVLAAAVVIGVVAFLPGDLTVGAIERPAPRRQVQPAPLTSGDGSVASPVPGAEPVAPAEPPPGAWMTYLVPEDILQAELRKVFPISENVVDLVHLRIDRPTFVADPDGAFLRLRLDVEARVLDGNQRLPGTAVVRTQLAYDRAARQVRLRNAQLVELTFSGDAARAARALEPVLAAALAAEMQGYVIFEVPADGLWWLKTGVGFVRDVYVNGGRVAIALGP